MAAKLKRALAEAALGEVIRDDDVPRFKLVVRQIQYRPDPPFGMMANLETLLPALTDLLGSDRRHRKPRQRW
jgi:hypothetical protein